VRRDGHQSAQISYIVGEDTRALLEGRQGTTDEEWIANGRDMDDEEYCTMMEKHFGVDLFR
jgi:hypothetical protein